MAGWLNKLGLTKTEETTDYSQYLQTPAVTEVAFDTSALMSAEQIYQEGELQDLSKSIFKVDELKKAMPSNLATEVLKVTIIGVLATTGLLLPELLVDAESRLALLNGVQQHSTNETDLLIETNQASIEDLIAQIDVLKQANNDRLKLQEEQDKIVENEITTIEAIVKFIS